MRLQVTCLLISCLLATKIVSAEAVDYCGPDTREEGFELILMHSLTNVFDDGSNPVSSEDLITHVSDEAKQCGIPEFTKSESKLIYEKALTRWYELNEEKEAFPEWLNEYRIRGGNPAWIKHQVRQEQRMKSSSPIPAKTTSHLPVPTRRLTIGCSLDFFKSFAREQFQRRVAWSSSYASSSDDPRGCRYTIILEAGSKGKLIVSAATANWIFPMVSVELFAQSPDTSLQQIILKLPIFQ